MRRPARRPDTTLALLAGLVDGWAALSRSQQQQLARHVELVALRAGTLAARAGVPGRWRTAVVTGVVATTCPPAVHEAGSAFEHGPETALLAVEDGVLLTWPAGLALIPVAAEWSTAPVGSHARRNHPPTRSRPWRSSASTS